MLPWFSGAALNTRKIMQALPDCCTLIMVLAKLIRGGTKTNHHSKHQQKAS